VRGGSAMAVFDGSTRLVDARRRRRASAAIG
jgi:hypothetical protein